MTHSRRIIGCIAIIAFIFLFFVPLFADGGFFYDIEIIGNSAESPNQRAIIIHDGIRETLILQVKYSGTADNFAWIVPVPRQPEANGITTTSDSIFQILHEYTQPRVYIRSEEYGSGGTMKGLDSYENVVLEQGVTIWEMLQVGPYDVTVLSGISSQALIDWLNTNGYSYSDDAESIIDFYIQKEWFFVASKVNVQENLSKSSSSYQSGLPALKISFYTDQPVFPLRISEISSASENEIELYVAAPHRMICDSYRTVTMDRDEVEEKMVAQKAERNEGFLSGMACFFSRILDPAETQLVYDYEVIFRDQITLDDRPTFAIEWAGRTKAYDPVQYPDRGGFNGYFNGYFPPDTRFWITRLRTILSPDDMQADVTFVPDPDGDESVSLRIFPDQEQEHWNPWSASLLIWPGFFVIPFITFKRIRKKYWREWVIGLLLFLII
ncbi:DUF2330 domain-containing protein [bacterium]|nr:DUF2330 domain-containing protein [bacterium]